MGSDLLDLTDRLWRGETSVEEVHPVVSTAGLDEVAPGIAFLPSFGNITGVAVEGSVQQAFDFSAAVSP